MSTPLTEASRASFESLRDYFTSPEGAGYFDSAFWIGVCDRALGRDPAYDALGHIVRPRRYRYADGWGANKALVAETPANGVLWARNIDHANCLRDAAKKLGRKVRVRQVTPGKPERSVILLT